MTDFSDSLQRRSRAAQDRPVDVVAQILATHRAAGNALDRRAVLCGHLSLAGAPLAQDDGREAETLSQAGCRLDGLCVVA
ncbi:hypothetical protein UFOVP935_39 [uncultured Caudovirales phage]|uniref:Uncharacterized protein n=1 Tax=uncultured Caudovirales phage TaxID=2100421 RepID=A0A6J5PRA0_9CAUD|nr:hypothetical protein UFOVP935_39 [uncultured Caudovirales phage]